MPQSRALFMSVLAAAAAVAVLAAPALADEGMWLFERPPTERMKSAYGFAPDTAWLNRVSAHSVRLDNGCSGAVVSAQGLVVTNHHCLTECLSEISSPRSNHVANGFVASQRRDERICPGLQVSILRSTTDVTDRLAAAAQGASQAARAQSRRLEKSRIETEACADASAQLCQVVDLYRGAQSRLYRYDRYSDVRLAFAPEVAASFFGGEIDNFSYPRFAFDVGLLRLYRDGEPVRFPDALRFAGEAPADGQLVLTAGFPGDTRRDMTLAQLARERDHDLPVLVEYLAQLRGAMLNESAKGEEENRQLFDFLSQVENSLKAYRGQRLALVEPSFIASRQKDEARLRDKLGASRALQQGFGDPFGEIEAILERGRALHAPYRMLERRFGAGSTLLADARTLVRAAEERSRPDAERLPEFADDRLAGWEASIVAQGAVHPALERLLIEFWLDQTRESLGADDPAVKALFGARTSAQIASEIVRTSQVGDHGFRGKMWRNPAMVTSTTDPAIALVRRVDEYARAARANYHETLSTPLDAAAVRLAGLRLEIDGDSGYPDATFSLRLSYGAVKGWNDPVHGLIAPFTRIAGLWTRATGAYPYRLPDEWNAARDRLPDQAVMNFVTTNDTVGGGSGSPLLDAQARVVGLVFDGNLQSLGGAYGYDPALNRTVALSAPLIVEALRTVYGAEALADELSR